MNATISLKLFATLAGRMPEDANHYPINPGMTVQDIVEKLRLTEDEAKLIFVNNKRAFLSSVLHDGDRLGIFPPVGGG